MALINQSITRFNNQDLTFRFSEIADLLKGRLTNAELNDLLVGLLAKEVIDVNPGDLITADWAMGVIRRLERLEIGNLQAHPVNAAAFDCFFDTSNFYEGLVIQGTFVPPEGTVPLKAVLQVTAALQRIPMMSMAGIAMLQSADDTALLRIFQHLYDLQSDLVALLSSQVLGNSDVGQKLVFCQLLKIQLDQDQANGVLSLHSALNQVNLAAAISAQNRINGIVMNQSGDVTLGNLQVVYQGSDNGEVLVPTDTASYRYYFRVFNKTNRVLNVQVSASFRGLRALWPNNISITGGSQLTGLSIFNPSNPSDNKAYRDIEVVISGIPTSAQIGEMLFLDLEAGAPAPISRFHIGSVQLTVGSQKIPPQPNWIRFIGDTPKRIAGDPDKAQQGKPVIYRFSYEFHSSTSPTTPRNFVVKAIVTSPFNDAGSFSMDFSAGILSPIPPIKDRENSSVTLCQSTPFPLSSDQQGDFQIEVERGLSASGKTLTFSVTMQSDDLALTIDQPPTISVTAAQSTT